MGLRLGYAGALPEVTINGASSGHGPDPEKGGVIRFGWDYQYEHEHGLNDALREMRGARWTDVVGFRVLVVGRPYDATLARIWGRDGVPPGEEGSPVWVLWCEHTAVLFFRDRSLASAIEKAMADGRVRISEEERVRDGVVIGGGEGVLTWEGA